ncbi:hypothetical protein [Enterococcus cecorum]|uniref:hypothetical protein n=1 Tax=Enterococcus cecorum TaxID=44008 RepID=UPI0032C47881
MGNKSYPTYNDIYFTVHNVNNDNNQPVVESISIDKTEVTLGDTVTITAKVSDESGIKSVWGKCNNNGTFMPDIYMVNLHKLMSIPINNHSPLLKNLLMVPIS